MWKHSCECHQFVCGILCMWCHEQFPCVWQKCVCNVMSSFSAWQKCVCNVMSSFSVWQKCVSLCVMSWAVSVCVALCDVMSSFSVWLKCVCDMSTFSVCVIYWAVSVCVCGRSVYVMSWAVYVCLAEVCISSWTSPFPLVVGNLTNQHDCTLIWEHRFKAKNDISVT